jgi:hypothetical protein
VIGPRHTAFLANTGRKIEWMSAGATVENQMLSFRDHLKSSMGIEMPYLSLMLM